MSNRRVKPTRVAPVGQPEPVEPRYQEERFAAPEAKDPSPNVPRARQVPPPGSGQIPAAGSGPAAVGDSAVAFRPLQRPPMAQLVILDDGAETGEIVRLRRSTTVIGRTQGDVIVPHDPLISGKHLEIERAREGDQWRWFLNDTNSTNGTFIRVPSCRLRPGNEILLGSNRYRFNLPDGEPPEAAGDGWAEPGTRGWSAVPKQMLKGNLGPHLVELDGDDEIATYRLSGEDRLGNDRSRANLVLADPAISGLHALITNHDGHWTITDLDSLNGVWIRVERTKTSRRCEFQLGEQRFILRVF